MPHTNNNPRSNKPRILSGMRPTGKLHLGNYMGALRNWVRLQNETDEAGEPKYDCYFFIADYHALTTDYADPSQLQQNTLDVALDWLAAGLDPEKSTLFVQSHLPQHAELHLLFSMITPLSWLERVPSYKDQQENLTGKDLTTYGFLGYPLLQAADILLYRPHFVPVGADQVAHVELTREVARRFNNFYAVFKGWRRADEGRVAFHAKAVSKQLTLPQVATFFDSLLLPSCTCSEVTICQMHQTMAKHDVDDLFKATWREAIDKSGFRKITPGTIFPEPESHLTPSPKLPGTDGRKMSKSYGNTIAMDEPEADIRAKLKTMVTDPARVRRSDPGNPEVCPVGDLHKVFSPQEVITKVWEGCQTAGIGCIECKGWLADAILAELAPMSAVREKYATTPDLMPQILAAGAERANIIATETLQMAQNACGLMPRQPRKGGMSA